MVSVQLLAQLDTHLRAIMTQASSMKKDADNIDRPFGGINILFCGDFCQLDPPTGTGIAKMPTAYISRSRQYASGQLEEHGQHIFWGGGVGSVQGVTELEECVRLDTKDGDNIGREWLLEVQNQFRNGNLTQTNHNFLHGRQTDVPGSWIDGRVTCGNTSCTTQEN